MTLHDVSLCLQKISSPLSKRLKETQGRELEPFKGERLEVLDVLKILISPAGVKRPKRKGQSTPYTDAFDRRVFCTLLQKEEDGRDPSVGYWGRMSSEPEKNLDTNHREFFTVARAFILLRPYLEGTRLIIGINHHALRSILNATYVTGTLPR